MALTDNVMKRIITKLLHGEDYRIEIVPLINAAFLKFVVNFFKKVVDAKLAHQHVTVDWYKEAFLNGGLDSKDIAINSGLNMKTISNMFNSAKRQVVIEASNEHYNVLYETIRELAESEEGLDLTLNLQFNDVSVSLNISETLIVINTLAVKRAALRGGLWSTAGKSVEKPLMQTLCELYSVPAENYQADTQSTSSDTAEDFTREVDFHLIKGKTSYKCEVKLMGKGNPESADAFFARGSHVFITDKLSDTNKRQLDSNSVEWVELWAENGFQRFKQVLEHLEIPHNDSALVNIDANIETILNQILS